MIESRKIGEWDFYKGQLVCVVGVAASGWLLARKENGELIEAHQSDFQNGLARDRAGHLKSFPKQPTTIVSALLQFGLRAENERP